ncbi:hypothetical protein [Chlorogloeopsis sp. ULAP02]
MNIHSTVYGRSLQTYLRKYTATLIFPFHKYRKNTVTLFCDPDQNCNYPV